MYVEQSEVTPYEQSYYKESDLPGHLANGNDENTPLTSNKNNHQVEDNLLNKDFQLYQAFTLLKGWSVFQHHAKPLDDAKDEQERVDSEE